MNTTCERWHWSKPNVEHLRISIVQNIDVPNEKHEMLNKEYIVHGDELERIYDLIKHEVRISQSIIFDEIT